MGNQRAHAQEQATETVHARAARRRQDPAQALLQLQRDPLSLAPPQLLTVQRHVGRDALAGMLGSFFELNLGAHAREDEERPAAEATGGTEATAPAPDTALAGDPPPATPPPDAPSSPTPPRGRSASVPSPSGVPRAVAVQRQAQAPPAPGQGDALKEEMTPEEAEELVKEEKEKAESSAGDAAPEKEEGDEPTDEEPEPTEEEGEEPQDQGMPQVKGEEDPIAGLQPVPPTDQSTVPNYNELSSGLLASYATEKAWHDEWNKKGRQTGLGDEGTLVLQALGTGAAEGLTGGVAAALVGQVTKRATGFIPFSSGFLAVGEMVIKGQSPTEWLGAQATAAGGKMVGGWEKITGEGADWIDVIEGIVDILDGLNDLIGTLSTICYIIAAVLLVGGLILSLIGIGGALLAAAPWFGKAGTFLGKVNSIVGIVLAALRLIIMTARSIQILTSEADPETQAKRLESLRKSTEAFTKESVKSWTNKGLDKAADKAKAKMSSTETPDQPGGAPKPPGADEAQQATAQTQQQRGALTRALDAYSAGGFSQDRAGIKENWQEGWGLQASEKYGPDFYREKMERERATAAIAAQEPQAAAPAPTAADGETPTPAPTGAAGQQGTPQPGTPGEQLGFNFPAPPAAGGGGPGAPGSGGPGHPGGPGGSDGDGPRPPGGQQPLFGGDIGADVDAAFAGIQTPSELKAITAPLPLEAIPPGATVPQGVQPGAIGHYDPLTSRPDYAPHPFALESNPPGAPGASQAGGKMPSGVRQEAGVFAEHGTAASIMGEVVPGYEVHGPQGQTRKGHGTRHQPTISVEESTKSHKDTADDAALQDIRARQAAGEDVPWIEAVVGGNVRLREAAEHGGSQVPGYQHTKGFLSEIDFVHGDPRHGFQERRVGGPPVPHLQGVDTDAGIDAMFAPYMTPSSERMTIDQLRAQYAAEGRLNEISWDPTLVPPPDSGGTTPPSGTGSPPAPTPAPASEGGAPPTAGASPAGPQLDLPFPAQDARPAGQQPGTGPAYGQSAPTTAATDPSKAGQSPDIVTQWEQLRSGTEKGAADWISGQFGGTGEGGEGGPLARASLSKEDADKHRAEWAGKQAQEMDKAHRSVTADLPPPPLDKEKQLEAAAKTYAELDTEERRLRLQQQEISGLQSRAAEEQVSTQALQGLIATNRQAINEEQGELAKREEAQALLDQEAGKMGSEADQAGAKHQSQAGPMQDWVSRFLSLVGMVPTKLVSNPGEGSGAAGGMGEGFAEGGKGTEKASEQAQAAQEHNTELKSQTQECKAGYDETDAQLVSLQDLASSSLDDTRTGTETLQEARTQAGEKLEQIAQQKQEQRQSHQEAVQAMTAWAANHESLRKTGKERLESQMEAAREGLQERGADVEGQTGGMSSSQAPMSVAAP